MGGCTQSTPCGTAAWARHAQRPAPESHLLPASAGALLGRVLCRAPSTHIVPARTRYVLRLVLRAFISQSKRWAARPADGALRVLMQR